jgi:hypothetical protein
MTRTFLGRRPESCESVVLTHHQGMRAVFLVVPGVLFAIFTGGACGGTALQIPTDAGEESTAGDESRCLLCGPPKDVELPDVGVEDQVVFEDAPAFETGVEDSPFHAPDSDLPVDASGLLPPACAECLDKDCTTAYVSCFEDPSCVGAIRCLDHCVADGGAADPCAINCLGAAPGDAQVEGANLLACAQSTCSGPCGVSAMEAGAD